MAEIKLPTMSYKEIGEKGARYALDEVEYKGLTIRQWADKITGGEYVPVVQSHWRTIGNISGFVTCDKCGYWCGTKSKYCPDCGAKMDEEVQE